MARSYDSRRYPGGPYLEPTVQPAFRGPKRTGPIGELVPGDDIEVARILARLGRKPKREPIVYEIKLTGDLATDKQMTVVSTPPSDPPFYVLTCRRDMALSSLVAVELSCTFASTSGHMQMKVMNLTRTLAESANIYMLETAYPVNLQQGEFTNRDEEDALSYRINWDNARVQWRDRLGFFFPSLGTGIRGLQLGLWFE